MNQPIFDFNNFDFDSKLNKYTRENNSNNTANNTRVSNNRLLAKSTTSNLTDPPSTKSAKSISTNLNNSTLTKSTNSTNPTNSTNSTSADTEITEIVSEGHAMLAKTINISDDVLELVTPKLANDYKILPIEIRNNELVILFADAVLRTTAERTIINRLNTKKLNHRLRFYEVNWDVLKPAIDLNYTANLGFDRKNLSLDHTWISTNTDNNSKTLVLDANTKSFTEEQNKYKSLFIDAASIAHNAKATDLDFDLEEDEKSGQTSLVIRMNVDGRKITILDKITTIKESRKFGVVLRSIASLDTSNDQDIATGVIRGTLVYASRSARVELRCNVIPHEDGIMSFSVRIQTPDEFVYTPDNLGMFPEQQELMDRYFVRSVEGLALFAGATGVGKNTTQMTFLKKRTEIFPGWKTITIEDPVEMKVKGVLQFSVKKDKGYDYFIPGAMRHVPNMLIVGETRDQATGKLVLEAAESGHFVSTTVHAGNCARAIERMISLNCDIHKLADSLKIIVSQKLIGKICSKCTKVLDPITARIPKLKNFINNLDGDTQMEFLMATGKMPDKTECSNCHGTGVKGRVGIFEIMVFTNEMRDLIINRTSGYKIQQCAIRNGMTTLWVNGLKRALTGEVSLTSLERELGFPELEREGLELDRSILSDTDSDIEMPEIN